MNKMIENGDAERMERTVRDLVTDVQRTFDSSVIASFLLFLVVLVGVTPTQGIEEFANKLNLIVPLSSSFLGAFFFTLYNNLHFLNNNNRFRKYMKENLKNDVLNINSLLTIKERLSLFQLLMFIKIKLSNKPGIDYDEEINRMISSIIES